MVAVETKIQERGLSELSSVVSSSPSVSQPSPSPLPSLSLPSLSPYTPGHAALSGSESGSEDEEDEEEDLAAESGKRGEGRERAGEDREMEDEVTKEGEAAGYEWFSSVGVGLEPETRSSEMVDCADMKTIHDGDRADFVEMGDCGEINACSEGVDKTVDVVEDERQTVEDDKPDCCLGNKELGSKDHLSPVEERATITESIRSNQIAVRVVKVTISVVKVTSLPTEGAGILVWSSDNGGRHVSAGNYPLPTPPSLLSPLLQTHCDYCSCRCPVYGFTHLHAPFLHWYVYGFFNSFHIQDRFI